MCSCNLIADDLNQQDSICIFGDKNAFWQDIETGGIENPPCKYKTAMARIHIY